MVRAQKGKGRGDVMEVQPEPGGSAGCSCRSFSSWVCRKLRAQLPSLASSNTRADVRSLTNGPPAKQPDTSPALTGAARCSCFRVVGSSVLDTITECVCVCVSRLQGSSQQVTCRRELRLSASNGVLAQGRICSAKCPRAIVAGAVLQARGQSSGRLG